MKLVNGGDMNRLADDTQTDKNAHLLRDVANALAIAVEAIEAAKAPDVGTGLDFYEEVHRFEISLIQRALKHTGGNQAKAARLLGLKQTTLHGKIKQYQICQQVLIFNGGQARKELQ
jgi:transcriptional regulator with GAF, ATPase, and Fis domain